MSHNIRAWRAIPLAAALLAGVSAHAADAATWTDWQQADSAMAFGTLQLGAQSVQVLAMGPIKFAQTNGGTDYWTEGSPAAYGATGRPTGSDLIAIIGGDCQPCASSPSRRRWSTRCSRSSAWARAVRRCATTSSRRPRC